MTMQPDGNLVDRPAVFFHSVAQAVSGTKVKGKGQRKSNQTASFGLKNKV
jgi:hypothetical protein